MTDPKVPGKELALCGLRLFVALAFDDLDASLTPALAPAL